MAGQPQAREVAALVASWTEFAADLYRRLGGEDNLVVSPPSVATVLAMVLPGARGRTASEIAAVLHADLPPDRLATAAGALEAVLSKRAKEDELDLLISNTVWALAGMAMSEALEALLVTAFRAGLREADFVGDPEGARRAINDLVAEQTRGEIRELLPAGTVHGDTRLVLTNAIYLQARWLEAFEEAETRPQPFHLLGGGTTDAETMHRQARLGYAEGPGWRAVELPYRGGRLVMDVVVPDAGAFAAFQRGLTAERLREVVASLRPTEVSLALPRFAFESSLDLGDALAGLGMPTAFTPRKADFSGITEDPPLWIDHAVQKARVEVDERGTTAAAATALTFRAVSAVVPPELVELRVDRPFLFLVRELETGQILFLGRVVDPTA